MPGTIVALQKKFNDNLSFYFILITKVMAEEQ